MVNVGKVIPRYVEIGTLKGKIGSCEIKPANQGGLPLRFIQYTPISDSQTFLSWQRITSGKDVQVAADSILKLNHDHLHAFIYANEEGKVVPGALLLQKEQLTPEVRDALGKMVEEAKKDFERYSSWIVLLPGLEVNGKSAPCFDLPMTGLSPEKFGALAVDEDETAADVVALFKQSGSNILFVNPYYQSSSSPGS